MWIPYHGEKQQDPPLISLPPGAQEEAIWSCGYKHSLLLAWGTVELLRVSQLFVRVVPLIFPYIPHDLHIQAHDIPMIFHLKVYIWRYPTCWSNPMTHNLTKGWPGGDRWHLGGCTLPGKGVGRRQRCRAPGRFDEARPPWELRPTGGATDVPWWV